MADITQIADEFNIFCAVTLFHKMIKMGILAEDPNRPSNIVVYMSASDDYPEGWYSQNVFTATESLLSDKKSLHYVLEKANENGIELDEIVQLSKDMLEV